MFAAKTLNSEEAITLLDCRRLPGRLTTGGAAVVLGFGEHDIAPLVAAKLLRPLGKPARSAPKYFASVAIIAASLDEKWLSQATNVRARYWVQKNSRKKGGNHYSSPSEKATADLKE